MVGMTRLIFCLAGRARSMASEDEVANLREELAKERAKVVMAAEVRFMSPF